MVSILLPLVFGMIATNPYQVASEPDDPKALLAMIEALQNPIEDFRCEYEGHVAYLLEATQKNLKVKPDGIYDNFTGLFVWRANGDTYSDVMHRYEPEAKISRETIIVRPEKKEAEQYLRNADAAMGKVHIEDFILVNANRQTHLGEIFLIDELRRIVFDPNRFVQIKDATLAGRPVKLLESSIKGGKNVNRRFWIDLARSGHVVQRESYTAGQLGGRQVITLQQIHLKDATVWFPLRGEGYGFASIQDKKPVFFKEPISHDTIYVVSGSLAFNQHPNNSTFTSAYKLGTPISDNLRKTRTEYGQQKVPLNPTKVQSETLLRQQIAEAEKQKTELFAEPTTETAWKGHLILSGAFGVILIGSLIVMVRRR